MSIEYYEGFDDGAVRGILAGTSPTISTAVARTGTRSLKCFASSGSFTSSQYWAPVQTRKTGRLYVALYMDGYYGAPIVVLNDNTTSHIYVNLRGDGRFEVSRAGTALTGGIGTFVYTRNTWVHLGIEWDIDNVAGKVEVRINGNTTPDINVTGADTQNGANAQVTQVGIGWPVPIGGTRTIYVDDIVVQNLLGVAPENGWLGDVEVRYTFPNAIGDENDFTLAGSVPAATRHESTDEVPPNDATDYIQSNVVGDKVLMNYEDIVGSGTIYAVSQLLRAVKASAGSRSIVPREKLGTTVRNGADIPLSTSWITYAGDIWHRDPDGNVWTPTNFNNSQGGAEVTV